MSATPAPSNQSSDSLSPAVRPAQDAPSQEVTSADSLVLAYLRERGYKNAEHAFREALFISTEDGSGEATPPITVSDAELRKHLLPFWQRKDRPQGENALTDPSLTLQSLLTTGVTTPSVANLLTAINPGGADEILSLDPTDKHEGYRDLEAWVDGSLDMYRPELRPILFPIFCYFYLDLIQSGFRDAGLKFFNTFSYSLAPLHSKTLHHLTMLLLPAHVQQDELAQRFRNEKYSLRMSRSGFGLLVGWLTEGVGGESTGAGEGFFGEKGRRGRAAVMRVVNDHLRFDVTSSSSSSISPHTWEESTGLLSSLVPQSNGIHSNKKGVTNPAAFNASQGGLKLGSAPLDEGLTAEMERVLREQALTGMDGNSLDFQQYRVPQPSSLVSPALNDLPPQPPSFTSIDVKREVEQVRDARRRIQLDPLALALEKDTSGAPTAAAKAKALPSICAYTIHDSPDGIPCAAFSPDSSILAAGFSESYIRLWSLKGEKLRARDSSQPSFVRDSTSLRHKVRDRDGSSTRKLIGHSGPVYALSFDPLSGSAAPPQYLLSSSADTTVRLWSMDTMSSVVVYRGHQNPVWDVQWSPRGIYFATGSRDKTARLWSSDRISALRVYAGHLSDVDCVRFHPNSLYLATGSSDWTCRLWDMQRGATVRVFIGHQGAITSLAISPDGRYLASAGEDLAINLWDLGSGRRIKKMTGHTASIYSLAFSNESSLLVSGGADWTVRCWNVKSEGSSSRPGALENGSTNGINANDVSNNTDANDDDSLETKDLMATFPTKRTPVVNVHMTPRNLCLISGPHLSPEQR